jgi:hypothetical protein
MGVFFNGGKMNIIKNKILTSKIYYAILIITDLLLSLNYLSKQEYFKFSLCLLISLLFYTSYKLEKRKK